MVFKKYLCVCTCYHWGPYNPTRGGHPASFSCLLPCAFGNPGALASTGPCSPNFLRFWRNSSHNVDVAPRPPRGLVAGWALNVAQEVLELSYTSGLGRSLMAAGALGASNIGEGVSSGSWTGAVPPSLPATALRTRFVFSNLMWRIVCRGGVLPSCEGKTTQLRFN
jgi:hypothetical protein